MTLLQRLEQIQKEQDIPDTKMAGRLDISRAAWSNIRKAGRGGSEGRNMGLQVLAAIGREFPELRPFVLDHLLQIQTDRGKRRSQVAA